MLGMFPWGLSPLMALNLIRLHSSLVSNILVQERCEDQPLANIDGPYLLAMYCTSKSLLPPISVFTWVWTDDVHEAMFLCAKSRTGFFTRTGPGNCLPNGLTGFFWTSAIQSSRIRQENNNSILSSLICMHLQDPGDWWKLWKPVCFQADFLWKTLGFAKLRWICEVIHLESWLSVSLSPKTWQQGTSGVPQNKEKRMKQKLRQ